MYELKNKRNLKQYNSNDAKGDLYIPLWHLVNAALKNTRAIYDGGMYKIESRPYNPVNNTVSNVSRRRDTMIRNQLPKSDDCIILGASYD